MTEQTSQPELLNSLSQLAYSFSMSGFMGAGYGQQIDQTTTLTLNNRLNLITQDRLLLSKLYVQHGIVQSLIDQPVDDAFRTGFDISTAQLKPEEVEAIVVFMERNGITSEIMQAIKWARLFGGGGLITVTGDDHSTPMDITKLGNKDPLSFKAADLWELNDQQQTASPLYAIDTEIPYSYYNIRLHRSRVLPIFGKRPPSWYRPQLRGWGLSELEKLIRSFNQYVKSQDVIFELLDEAKIDVMKINGFNQALANPGTTEKITKRIQDGNRIKNYQNAIVMDKEDDYDQKQMAFTGLGEMLLQNRQGIAGDLKMPMTKLFGMSAAGFSSGEDDIENYNGMCESEIRRPNKYVVVDVIRTICQHLFGMVPTDITIHWRPMRVLSAEQMETIKDKQFNRVLRATDAGLMLPPETKRAINQERLLPIAIDEKAEIIPTDQDDPDPKDDKKDKKDV